MLAWITKRKSDKTSSIHITKSKVYKTCLTTTL